MSKPITESIELYGLSSKTKKKTLFSKIGIIGCGREGQNIARIASVNGIEVIFLELSQAKIDLALEKIGAQLDLRIESWGLTLSEKKAILSKVKGTLKYEDLKDCDFIIEAVRADEKTGKRSIQTRKEIFAQLEAIVSPEAIISTNATTVVITELASELKHPERCISLHFYESSSEARIIEVVKGVYTSTSTYDKVCQFVKLVRRDVIDVQESAGLVSVRLFCVQLNEACNILMEGVASMADIDKTFIVGYGQRMGIFTMADTIGLDKVERWMENIYDEFGGLQYKPSPLIKRLVRAKQLGVVSGKGFYSYDEEGIRVNEVKNLQE